LRDFFTIPRAAWIDGSKVGLRELLVRVSSMWSIARITVARLGVKHEEKRVVSLNI
jgi:hypothetical protein